MYRPISYVLINQCLSVLKYRGKPLRQLHSIDKQYTRQIEKKGNWSQLY